MGNTIYLTDFTAVNEGISSDETVNIEQICKDLQGTLDSSKEISIINLNGENETSPTVFSNFNGEYCSQKYVGVLEFKGNKIMIGSRFDSDRKQYFLQYVFSNAFDIHGKIFDEMQTFGKSEDSWDLLLIIVFIKELKDAMKKGLYRIYQTYQYNNSKVKGQIDIPRHIKLNIIPNGKVAYNSREYSTDNFYNYLFLKAYEIIDQKYPSILRKLVSNDENVKNGITTLKSNLSSHNYKNQDILKHTNKKIVHPVYKKYEELRKTSTLILRKMGMNTMNNDNSKVTGFVIDMTKLWEKFLEKTMFNRIEPYNLRIAQDSYTILNGKRIIQPDFYWKNKNLVIDAKYKRTWGMTLNNDWSQVREDVFQVLSYMLSLECDLGGVVFPTEINKEFSYDEKLSVYPNGDLSKFFFRLPYFIKKYDNYKDFARSMEDQQDVIINKIKQYLE